MPYILQNIGIQVYNRKESLNRDGQQFHQYQQNEQSPLNSEGQQFHQYQQNEQSPLTLTRWTQNIPWRMTLEMQVLA